MPLKDSCDNDMLQVPIDTGALRTHDDYIKVWERLPRLEITMVEKNEQCRHNLGDTFTYANPYQRPENVCFALLHVLDLYTWRASMGFPSWNGADRRTFRIHCPDPKGTVWELRAITK
jgi:uncharacterized repeat protein (TIGR04076 family)